MENSYLIEINDEALEEKMDLSLLVSAVEASLIRFKIPKAVFSIAVVDGDQMKELNNQYLGHDYDTDVLSFCLHDPDDDQDEASDGENAQTESTESDGDLLEEYDDEEMLPDGEEFQLDRLQGQLIVSIDYAKKQSEDLGSKLIEELALYVVHGSLHVLGFDDHSDEDRQEMRDLEKEILATLEITPVWPQADHSSSAKSESELG